VKGGRRKGEGETYKEGEWNKEKRGRKIITLDSFKNRNRHGFLNN
jgi:hypothetical protein